MPFQAGAFQADAFQINAFQVGIRIGGGGSKPKGKRPRYWWEKEEEKDVELPYREPEKAPRPVPFDATNIDGELLALDARLDTERRDKRKKRMRRAALLAMMLDD
jgi:hypothetical protein